MHALPPAVSRNALWVIRRGLLGMVVVAAGFHSVLFAGLISAEWQMLEIAKAAAVEATLPKASRASVERLASNRLEKAGVDVGVESIAVEHDRKPAQRWYSARPGDRLAVTISTPAPLWFPSPVSRWCEWFGPRQIRVRAERQRPHGRRTELTAIWAGAPGKCNSR